MIRVSLTEYDAELELLLENHAHEYKGKLNAPQHFSFFERITGFHGDYDPSWVKKFRLNTTIK
jgi:hypothetical protein